MADADWRLQYYVVMQFAEVNILRASGKEEEARTLKASVTTLKNQNNELEKQVQLKIGLNCSSISSTCVHPTFCITLFLNNRRDIFIAAGGF